MSSQHCYTLVLIIPKRFFLFCFVSIPKKVAIFAILRIVLTTEMKVCVQAPVKAVKIVKRGEPTRAKKELSKRRECGRRKTPGRTPFTYNKWPEVYFNG